MNKLVFLKLRTGEDFVGYLSSSSNSTHYIMNRPLHIFVETDMGTGRQMIEVRECLPPILVELEDMSFPVEEVNLVTPIRETFTEELASVIALLYSVKPRQRGRNKKEREDGDNVISLFNNDSHKIH